MQFGEYKTVDGDLVFKRVAVEEFTTASETERVQHENKNGLWFVGESALPVFSVDDV